MTSPLVSDTVKINYYFPQLKDSNSFGIVDYDAHMNTRINYSIDHVFVLRTFKN